MATTTDLEQTGRDANILNNHLDGAPPLRPAYEYGRLGQLLLRLIEELTGGTLLQYDGRVDSVADLPATGQLNHFYLVGPEDASEFDEYFWVEPDGETGHWDRLGSVAIIIDDHLDLNSTNPVQNGIITAAINAINLALAATAKQSALAPVLVFATAYTDGTLVTYAGELYKTDSVNGSYITEDQTTSTSKFVKVDVASLFDGLATVAKTGSYTDLSNKPTIPVVTDRLKSIAAAAEYDSSHTYTTGEYMTLDGELYRCDPNGDYVPVGENLFVTYATRMKDSTYGYQNNKYLESYGSPGSIGDNRNMYISGTIPLKQNTRYKMHEAGWSVESARYVAVAIITSERMNQFYARALSYGAYGAATSGVFSTGSYQYVAVSMPKDDTLASQYYLYELSPQKFIKTTVADELAGKADTFTTDATPTQSSTNPVQSGGVYTALDGKVDDGGDYFEVNGIRVYVSSTTPTGSIPEGSLGIGF